MWRNRLRIVRCLRRLAGAVFFQLADYALTGVVLQDQKAVLSVDDQEVMFQYVLPQYWP